MDIISYIDNLKYKIACTKEQIERLSSKTLRVTRVLSNTPGSHTGTGIDEKIANKIDKQKKLGRYETQLEDAIQLVISSLPSTTETKIYIWARVRDLNIGEIAPHLNLSKKEAREIYNMCEQRITKMLKQVHK